MAAGPDIDKAGTGFSALYNAAIAQWCMRDAMGLDIDIQPLALTHRMPQLYV